MTTSNDDVQGRCPACRGTSLFLADGGHVTCRRIDCPNPSAADELLHGSQHAETGEIQLTRKLGHGLIVDVAPSHARMALDVLATPGWAVALRHDLINIADQVSYRVVGYDPGAAALVLELDKDWRPAPAAKLAPRPRDCLFARACRASDPCATCDQPKEQP